MRRQGYEFQVSRPKVITKKVDGKILEPMELLTIDTPEDTAAQQSDIDFDLKALLESEFGEEASLFTAESDSDFDYGPETVDYLQDEGVEDIPAPEAPVEAELPEEDLLDDDLLVGDFDDEPLDDDDDDDDDDD